MARDGMPTYGTGKADEPMMSGMLYKRSSLHGTFQPRQFELLLNKQTGEVSNTAYYSPSTSRMWLEPLPHDRRWSCSTGACVRRPSSASSGARFAP